MTYEEHKAWLATLKVGDTVCVNTGNGWRGNGYTFYAIERTTATQLISTRRSMEVRFRKSDGREVGSDNYSKIEPVTDKVREVNLRNSLESWASNLKPKNLSTDCLSAMKQAHDRFGGAA